MQAYPGLDGDGVARAGAGTVWIDCGTRPTTLLVDAGPGALSEYGAAAIGTPGVAAAGAAVVRSSPVMFAIGSSDHTSTTIYCTGLGR
jgi:hypothetical protein